MSKTLKELAQGDVVKLEDGTAQITSARRATWIRHVDGPAIDVQWEVISGPGKGETGYYVVAKLDTDPTALPEFERAIRLDETVLRHLVVIDEGAVPAVAKVDDESGDDSRGEDVLE